MEAGTAHQFWPRWRKNLGERTPATLEYIAPGSSQAKIYFAPASVEQKMQQILSEKQKSLLSFFGKEKQIYENFYWGGGTALAEKYLRHRLSEDLDFFSEVEFDPLALSVIFKNMQKAAGIKGVEYIQSFNRSLFFLDFGKKKIKTEFTYFPFPRIDARGASGNLSIDSLLDIAVNKLFTVYQRPRSRDFIDLYCILQKEKEWTLDDFAEKAQVKFDTHLDPIQLGAQYLKAVELKDYPKMLVPLRDSKWQDFFTEEAKKLKGEIFK